jgi:Restriction alleviation protein Lar
MKSMDELNQNLVACPFCEGMPEMELIGNGHTIKRAVTVRCPQCRCQRTDAALRLSMEDLIVIATDNWNKRPTPTKPCGMRGRGR